MGDSCGAKGAEKRLLVPKPLVKTANGAATLCHQFGDGQFIKTVLTKLCESGFDKGIKGAALMGLMQALDIPCVEWQALHHGSKP